MRVISLGWGVQSFGLAAMSAIGVLPPVDAAIHANTTHERYETYQFAAKWTPWLEERGMRVVTVQPYRRSQDVLTEAGELMIAAHTCWPDGRPSGMLHRQCTHDWKLMPIRRWLRAATGRLSDKEMLLAVYQALILQYKEWLQELQEQEQGKEPIEMWLGITLDEIERTRVSDVKYIKHKYPFLEFERPMRRSDVVRWLLDNGLEVPVKSSCVFCPYHDKATWREIQLSSNGDWEKVLAVDEAIRHKRPGYICYLIPQRKPLSECDFRSQEEHGQLTLWEAEECSGNCFL